LRWMVFMHAIVHEQTSQKTYDRRRVFELVVGYRHGLNAEDRPDCLTSSTNADVHPERSTGGFPLVLNCWAGSTSRDEGTTAPHQTCDHHW
jgi:hypothetical protein